MPSRRVQRAAWAHSLTRLTTVCRGCYSVAVSSRPRRPPWPLAGLFVLVTLLVAASAGAQSSGPTTDEFWPELNYFQRLSDNARAMVQASAAITDGDIASEAYGANLDLFLKPKPFQTYVLGAQSVILDRHLLGTLRLGYRYSDTPPDDGQIGKVQNRLLVEVTGRQYLWSILVSDRNGFDWRWINGQYSTRYRNRLRIEHTGTIGSYQITPYANAEVIYLVSGGYWNQIRYQAGLVLPVIRHVSTEIYYNRSHLWNPKPGNINALGLKVIVSY
jgi:hypothetical protein